MTTYVTALGAALIATAILSGGSLASAACPQDSKVASVTVTFDYDKSRLNLPGTVFDQKALNAIAKNFTANSTTISDAQFSTKAAFIAKLRASVQGRDYVNFNYSGHGTLLNGKFALILPGFSAKCSEEIDAKTRTVKLTRAAPKDSTCTDFLVTEAELRQVFAGKSVFGIVDACHSGGIDLGPDSAVMTATGKDYKSMEAKMEGGFFTQRIAGILKGTPICPIDYDYNGKLTYEELKVGIYPVSYPVANFGGELVTNGQSRDAMEVLSLDPPDVQPTEMAQVPEFPGSTKPWLKCFPVGKMPAGCSMGTYARTDEVTDEDTIMLITGGSSYCKLAAHEGVLTTGRRTKDGLIEISSSSKGECKGKTGWVRGAALKGKGEKPNVGIDEFEGMSTK